MAIKLDLLETPEMAIKLDLLETPEMAIKLDPPEMAIKLDMPETASKLNNYETIKLSSYELWSWLMSLNKYTIYVMIIMRCNPSNILFIFTLSL